MSNGRPAIRRRSRSAAWLLSAVALTIGPALLLPAAAPASRQNRTAPQGACPLTIELAPATLTAGEAATVTGSLLCATSTEAAEQTVTVYQRVAGTPGFNAVGTATTDASGVYRFTTEALQANGAFYVRADGKRSRQVPVKVAPLVTISGPAANTQLSLPGHSRLASAGAGNTVTFAGTVSPGEAGGHVILQRESAVNENWSPIAVGEVGAEGKYSITHTFSIPGTIDVRVVVRAHGLLAGVSEPLAYQIARRQNPRLTIQASPAQLTYGQSVIVSGTAPAAPNVPVTLLARTPGDEFAPVATASTDASGNYVFPAQSPLHSTSYKVSGVHTTSTTLFEGVKVLLSANVSSTTIQDGEPLTFSGTIAPVHVGQVVDLERQNPEGIGFHVVDVGTVDAGGSYSIEHTVSGAGTDVFRIKVAGDAENQAAASELFKIQVTPAPGAVLGALKAKVPGTLAEPPLSVEPERAVP